MNWISDNELLFDFHIQLCTYLHYENPIIIEVKTTCFYNLYKIYIGNKTEIFIKLHSSKYEVFYNGKSIYTNIKKRHIEELHYQLLEILLKNSSRNLSIMQEQSSNNIQLLKEFVENRYFYVSTYKMFCQAEKDGYF